MICHAQTEQGFASTSAYLGFVSFKGILQAGIIYNNVVDLDPVMKHFLSAFFTNNTGTTLLASRSGMPFPYYMNMSIKSSKKFCCNRENLMSIEKLDQNIVTHY